MNNKKYYIKYHSEMTDMTIYFVSPEKDNLKKYNFLCDLLLDWNYQKDFESVVELLKEKKIEILNDEVDEIDEDEFDEMLNYYSYRF